MRETEHKDDETYVQGIGRACGDVEGACECLKRHKKEHEDARRAKTTSRLAQGRGNMTIIHKKNGKHASGRRNALFLPVRCAVQSHIHVHPIVLRRRGNGGLTCCCAARFNGVEQALELARDDELVILASHGPFAILKRTKGQR